MISLALALLFSTPPTAPLLTVYETEGRQIAACAEYAHTHDERAIAVDLGIDGSGQQVIGSLECEDIAIDVIREPAFQKWYARTARMYHLSPDPDDRRHFYDYRGLFRDRLDGSAPDFEGPLWPDMYRLPGHPDFAQKR
jgi:hypothetical protein